MTRIIRKYANRRLYDTRESRYITLVDLKALVAAGVPVQVVDARSGADLTREVLLQLVAEQEALGRPILSQAVLTGLIRFYDHPLQKLATRYLEGALTQLQEQQRTLYEQMQGLAAAPAELGARLARQNLEWMQQLQQGFLAALQPLPREEDD